MSDGLASGNQSAAIAAATTIAIHAIASQNTRRPRRAGVAAICSTSTSSAAIANPRVEDTIENVDDEIDQHKPGCDEQHNALQDHKITGVDRADQQAANAGQRKNRLDQHRTA